MFLAELHQAHTGRVALRHAQRRCSARFRPQGCGLGSHAGIKVTEKEDMAAPLAVVRDVTVEQIACAGDFRRCV